MDTFALAFTFGNFLFHTFKSIEKVYLVALSKLNASFKFFRLVRAGNAGLVHCLYT